MVCLGRPFHFKFFKGCLPQILLGPFLNTLTYIFANPMRLLKESKHSHVEFFSRTWYVGEGGGEGGGVYTLTSWNLNFHAYVCYEAVTWNSNCSWWQRTIDDVINLVIIWICFIPRVEITCLLFAISQLIGHRLFSTTISLRISWYSFYWLPKDENLNRTWYFIARKHWIHQSAFTCSNLTIETR